MKALPVAAAVMLNALASQAQAPALAERLRGLLNADGLKADVSFLASDLLEGRGTPSRGLDLSAEYIAAQFRRAGLEAIGDDGYFQTASLTSLTASTDTVELTVVPGNSDLVDTLRVEPHPFLHTDFYVSGRSVPGAGLSSHSGRSSDRGAGSSPSA